MRSSRSCAASARWSTAYCSLTRCVNAFSVMAMNGRSYGTSKSGKPCASAASSSASGNGGMRETRAEAEARQPVRGEAGG
jgi:hypothetical protein